MRVQLEIVVMPDTDNEGKHNVEDIYAEIEAMNLDSVWVGDDEYELNVTASIVLEGKDSDEL